MGAMKDLVTGAATLPAVERLACHAGIHPEPVPVIASGGAVHDCDECARVWLAAWLAVADYLAAAGYGTDDEPAEHHAAVILSEYADTIAELHGVIDGGTRAATLRPFDSEHVKDRKRTGRWIAGDSPEGVRVIEFGVHHDRESRAYVATLTPLTIEDAGNGFTMTRWQSNDPGVRVLVRPCPRYSDKGLDTFRADALDELTANATHPRLSALLDRAAVIA